MAVGSIITISDFAKGREEIFDNSEEVEMTTIDELVKNEKINKVDFIKIDAEGFEKQVLKGAKETIKKFSPVIACSAYHLKDDKIEIPKIILSIDEKYRYRIEKRKEEDLIFWKP